MYGDGSEDWHGEEADSQDDQLWTQPPAGSSPVQQHPWPDHIIDVLTSHGFLPAQAVASLKFFVWSDCSGMNCEKFSMADLSAAMRQRMGLNVEWILFLTCEKDPRSLEFAKLNHAPRHLSGDMEKRCFKTGKVWCDAQEANIDIPTSGIDIYSGTFPCSPWTRRGPMAGMDHPDAKCLRIGVQTIAFLSRPQRSSSSSGRCPTPPRRSRS